VAGAPLSDKTTAAALLRNTIADSGAAFVIYDLEVTSWEGAMTRHWSGPGEFPEIIQIGAVKLSGAAGYAERGSLNLFVRPVLNPVLSDYIVDLTGITQAEIEAKGVPFAQALAAFQDFSAGCQAFSNGVDDEWIAANCALHDLPNPFRADDLVNIGPSLKQILGWSGQIFSSDFPSLIGAANTGSAHDGVDDARAIAVVLREILKEDGAPAVRA